jgi:hypothetical protein
MLHCRSGSMGSPLVSYGETQENHSEIWRRNWRGS